MEDHMPETINMMGTDLEQLVTARPVSTFQPGRKVTRKAQFGKFFTYFTQVLPLAASAVQNRTGSFTSDGKYLAFAVQKVACLADSLAAKAFLVNQPGGEQFSFDSMYLTHFGGGQYPRIIHPAWMIRANNVVSLVVSDAQVVPAPNNIRIAYFGQKIQATPIVGPMTYHAAKQYVYPALYTLNDALQVDAQHLGPLAANATRTYTIMVDADSDFEVQAITVASDAAITIQVQTDADNWFDTDILSPLLGGSLIDPIVPPLDPSGWHPFILPAPRWVQGAGYIKVVATNTVAAPVRAEVQFHGVRLYPAGGIR
jgi:hypothetical protein